MTFQMSTHLLLFLYTVLGVGWSEQNILKTSPSADLLQEHLTIEFSENFIIVGRGSFLDLAAYGRPGWALPLVGGEV